MQEKYHRADLCVVGGGLAGMATAIAAARHGLEVVLMQDRPVLGGNASSEIRMWVCGARGKHNRETGIIEEILLENLYRNPDKNWSIWDSLLYEKVKYQEGLTLLLNCSCNDLEMEGERIKSIKGWGLTTETWHTVEAKLFADCSGDSILAPLSGAKFRLGREARSEFDESIEPEEADGKTMGMSCLIQARETGEKQDFIPPPWAYSYESDRDLPNRAHDLLETNFWWIELSGEGEGAIHDTEKLRDELLKIAFGIWDHIKNQGEHGADNWKLEWVGFLPGKRESRRYVGDHILNQNEVRAGGEFEDVIAYGGWPMDDHHPDGFKYPGQPTIFHKAPSPFGIPYRSIYSENVDNLFFAGRNISTTHAAISSTRVMATCATLGQAAGTAAAVAAKKGLSPREVYEEEMNTLQEALLEDDCYLPGLRRKIPQLSREAELSSSGGDPQPLRNGIDRPEEGSYSGWQGGLGSWVEYRFKEPKKITEFRFAFDSDLSRPNIGDELMSMPCRYRLEEEKDAPPPELLKGFEIRYLQDDEWVTLVERSENHQRLVRLEEEVTTKAVRFVPQETWGAEKGKLFAWDVR